MYACLCVYVFMYRVVCIIAFSCLILFVSMHVLMCVNIYAYVFGLILLFSCFILHVFMDAFLPFSLYFFFYICVLFRLFYFMYVWIICASTCFSNLILFIFLCEQFHVPLCVPCYFSLHIRIVFVFASLSAGIHIHLTIWLLVREYVIKK